MKRAYRPSVLDRISLGKVARSEITEPISLLLFKPKSAATFWIFESYVSNRLSARPFMSTFLVLRTLRSSLGSKQPLKWYDLFALAPGHNGAIRLAFVWPRVLDWNVTLPNSGNCIDYSPKQLYISSHTVVTYKLINSIKILPYNFEERKGLSKLLALWNFFL